MLIPPPAPVEYSHDTSWRYLALLPSQLSDGIFLAPPGVVRHSPLPQPLPCSVNACLVYQVALACLRLAVKHPQQELHENLSSLADGTDVEQVLLGAVEGEAKEEGGGRHGRQ